MSGERQQPIEAPPAAGEVRKPPRAIDRIKATARELFYRQGIRAVGVDEIVHRAGVTKPTLYRNFASKDELAAAYMRDYNVEFWGRFDAAMAEHPGEPRAQLRAFLEPLGRRATTNGYRGCGMTNAAVEYPDRETPARKVAEGNKHELRARLTALAEAMGAEDPQMLGDGLLLLIEGAYASGQLFGEDGPARAVAQAADLLVEASLAKAGM